MTTLYCCSFRNIQHWLAMMQAKEMSDRQTVDRDSVTNCKAFKQ